MKIIILLAFIVIIGSLASAGFFMLRGGKSGGADGGRNMARALTVRIAVSVVLFIGLLVAYRLGWIHPSGLPIGSP